MINPDPLPSSVCEDPKREPRRSRRSASIPLALAGSALISALPDGPPIWRRTDSATVQHVVRVLQAGDLAAAARMLSYPDNYTAEELEEEVSAVLDSLRLLLREFGNIQSAEPTRDSAEFYEVGVGTGPRPFWWQSQTVASETNQYIYEVQFSGHGRGFIKVLTRGKLGADVPVAIDFGLPTAAPHSKERTRDALDALMDMMNVPAGHPSRSMEVRPWEAPPAR